MKLTRMLGIALAGSLSLGAGALGTVALAAGPAGADTGSAEATADNATCASGHWPGWVDGRPAGVLAQAAQGV